MISLLENDELIGNGSSGAVVTMTGSWTGGSNMITLEDTTGLRVGMGVSVPGMPEGALITEILDINTITVSQPIIDSGTGDITFSADDLYQYDYENRLVAA